MSDQVTCKAVLVRPVDPRSSDRLYLECSPDFKLRIISCYSKGTAPKESGPHWEYEERDGRLHITPSLLCTDTQFHTAYNWDCDYAVCPEGKGGYDHFYELNPEHKDA